MKKILFLLLLFVSCKKENETSPVPVMRNVKYEAAVINSLCLEINYDGATHYSTSKLSWDYTFQKEVGASLSLSGQACDGISSGQIVLSIYQDGQLTKTAKGYGWEYLTDIVK